MPESEASRGACIFCGVKGRKLTKEHAWPDWLADVFREFKSSTFYRDPAPTGDLQSWITKSFAATVRVVCVECNSTWMSEIENAAKPLLIPMVRPGPAITLDSYQKRSIANWAFLRAVVLQYTGGQVVVPQSHVTEFVKNRRPPLKSTIRVAAYNNPYALTSYRAGGGTFNRDSSGEFYFITETVGALAINLFGHTLPQTIDIDFGPLKPTLTWVWPAGGLASWPPKIGLDDPGVDALHNSFPAKWTDEARRVRDRGLSAEIRRRHGIGGPPSRAD